MEYLFFSVVAVCVTILLGMLLDFHRLSKLQETAPKSYQSDSRVTDLYGKFDACKESVQVLSDEMVKYVKDLEDVKKRVDVLTLKAGFKL